MADKIKLPPMMSHPECHTYVWTEQEKAAIRARDLEVARVVLEAAARVLDGECLDHLQRAIRNLKVSHAN